MSEKVYVDLDDVFASETLGVCDFLDAAFPLFNSARQRMELSRMLSSWGDYEKKFSKKSAANVRLGFAKWVLGEEDEALKILSATTGSTDGAYLYARCLKDLGHTGEALKVLDKALKKNAEPILGLLQAEIYIESDEVNEAAKLLKSFSRQAGKRAEYHYLAGFLAEIKGERNEAVGCYEKALEINEEHAKTCFRLALNLDRMGRDQEAIEYYERTMGKPPIFRNAVMNLGILYEDMGRYQEALDCFDLVLKASPGDRRARLYHGDAHASLTMVVHEELEREQDRRNQILRTPVTDFELSVRSRNCLSKMQIHSLGDLIQKTEAELLAYKNFGETSLAEIKEMLSGKGLRLGMGREEADKAARQRLAVRKSREAEGDNVRNLSIDSLDLSVRSRKCMDRLAIETIGDLIDRSETDLINTKNFGSTSMNEVKRKLTDMGLSLRT